VTSGILAVAAHHLDKQGNIQPLVDWYMIKHKEMESHTEASTLIYYAAIVAEALDSLAQSLQHAILTKD